MTVRVNEQKDLIEKADALFKAYDNFEIISDELASLGFQITGGNPDVAALENTGLEVYVHVNLGEDGRVLGYDIITFDEIKKSFSK
ncbi:hypothetical protein J2128_002490 [Methanomicrobium sp. W14]|uniref:hypothetical protein n=1 Tax=Methanomicrobium sp. W14 TaxID=2817839 RepID=UPI001AE257B2|nr:hypothetical protein [Methanomicrobium sp. W14]MBP2134524.1 hypothetical protein [Methanomicrobium sp. W14]